jgi:protein involved in polysaccharide export with SLBB domain
MKKKCFTWAALLTMGLQLGGCYSDYGPVVADSIPVAPLHVAARIHAGDKLKIVVYGEEALSGTYDVSPGGTVSMPLIGSVRAVGRTPADLERDIANRYRSGSFLQEPKVTVAVAEFQPIYVLGEAEKPGQYPYRSGLDVLTAVATAGGFTYRASKSTILIRHADDNIWQRYSLAAPILVEPGDLIRIPERYF